MSNFKPPYLSVEEVSRQFEEADKVGLHGVGGLGKTTMCKIMANFFNSRCYPGRCCHIEFPSDGDQKKILQECKKALKALANLSDDKVLNKAYSLDQVVQLMKENLIRYDVFLAIDNVWESSLEEAKRILGVGFSANTKILLTSRSEQVLKDLLIGAHTSSSSSTVAPLPSLHREEAFQIFQEAFGANHNLNSLLNRYQLHIVLDICFFSGSYHPLALQAVSQHLKRVCELEGFGKIADHLQSLISKEIRNRKLQKIEDLIKLNYENLPEHKRHMFLDIVVVIPNFPDYAGSSSPDSIEYIGETCMYARARQLLCFLYKEHSESDIIDTIYQLALEGLIQLEDIDGRAEKKIIKVHDLYSDLAKKEAASSPRFFTEGSTRSVEEIEWGKLERVLLFCSGPEDDSTINRFVHKLQQQECRKLQVLYGSGWFGSGVHFPGGIQLDLMPSLCILHIEGGSLTGINNWTTATGLAIVQLTDLKCAPPLKPIPSMPCLEELIIKNVNTVEGPPNLMHGFQHLKKLVLAEVSMFKKGYKGQSEASFFNSLKNLERLEIQHFNSRVLNLNALVKLHILYIKICESVETIEGLHALQKLELLHVEQCPSLKNLDGLSGLRRLEFLYVGNAHHLKRMPDLSGLTCLDRLVLFNNQSMEEMGDLSPALKNVEVNCCGALKKMPDLGGLTCLEELKLLHSKSIEEVGGLSPALKKVLVGDCGALKKMPDLSGLTCLEQLELVDNEAMEDVGGENLSSTLKELEVYRCKRLGRFPSWKECIHLQKLSASEQLGPWNAEKLANLQQVSLIGGKWTSINETLIGVTHLLRLTIRECDSLLQIEVGYIPSDLEYLEVRKCKALEEIGDLSALHRLKRLDVRECPRLKKLGGLCNIPHLQSMWLSDCGSLEESTIPDVSSVHVIRCGKLNDIHAL